MTWTTLPRSDIGGLAAIQAGTGPRVLLLHGVGLRAEAWRAQIDGLHRRATLIAPDMPGHGQSPLPIAPLALADYVKSALRVLRALDAPILVVGHSMGAMIALELAHIAPELVRGVAALNAIFERSPQAALAVQARANDLNGTTPPDPTPTLARWFGHETSAERIACQNWLNDVNPAGYKSAYTAFAHSNGPDRNLLQQFECPALFMTGGLEPNSTPDMSRAMADLTPKGRALIIDHAAHMMPMTHAPQVNAALMDFLDEVLQ